MDNRILDNNVIAPICVPPICVFSRVVAAARRCDSDITVHDVLTLVNLRLSSITRLLENVTFERTRLTQLGPLSMVISSMVMLVPWYTVKRIGRISEEFALLFSAKDQEFLYRCLPSSIEMYTYNSSYHFYAILVSMQR